MTKKLRIVLADDHGVLRAGLRALLESQPEFEVVGEAETGEEAVNLVKRFKPDLAIIDIRMPGGGLAAMREAKKTLPALSVLILSQYDDPAYLREALAGGARGFALKRSSGAELIEAIRTVGRGDVYLHPALAKELIEQSLAPHGQESGTHEALSDRELQVVRLIALGHSTSQV
ncbi:MAG: response regulator transcription factor, partial [Chloroflexota bacterium]|nr:response regulator transcription factor [Chloroflexota bacterium]